MVLVNPNVKISNKFIVQLNEWISLVVISFDFLTTVTKQPIHNALSSHVQSSNLFRTICGWTLCICCDRVYHADNPFDIITNAEHWGSSIGLTAAIFFTLSYSAKRNKNICDFACSFTELYWAVNIHQCIQAIRVCQHTKSIVQTINIWVCKVFTTSIRRNRTVWM